MESALYWAVMDGTTGLRVGLYRTVRRARLQRDVLDSLYGGTRYYVVQLLGMEIGV